MAFWSSARNGWRLRPGMAAWIERPIASRSSSTPETYPADTLRTMPELVLGPLLRHVGETEAVIWVETDAPCEVEVLGTRERTFCVCDHHYALVCCGGLERGAWHEYEVKLDGERVWPVDDGFPRSAFRTYPKEGALQVKFGSCRLAAPHAAPYSLRKDEDPRGREVDALHTLAQEMRNRPREEWPDVLLMLGDQVYADEVSPAARAFLESRRDPSEPPGERVLDFDEYTELYRESWSDPTIRWLLSTLSTAMIFDDHDVHDDWNISEAWLEEMRQHEWWNRHILGALASYWVYQHLGNLSPDDLKDPELLRRVKEADDAEPILEEFARRAGQEASGARRSYARDPGRPRLGVIDSGARLGRGPVRGRAPRLPLRGRLPAGLGSAVERLPGGLLALPKSAWEQGAEGYPHRDVARPRGVHPGPGPLGRRGGSGRALADDRRRTVVRQPGRHARDRRPAGRDAARQGGASGQLV